MSAPIALLDAAAQGGGPAIANVFERFSAVGATKPGSSEPENRFDGCGRHRPVRADAVSSLDRKKVESRQRIQRADGRADGHVGDLQIASRGLQIGMAQ